MATQAQIHANRANAALSTGPATPEGKAAAARNSLSHGLSSAKFAVLPTENADEYQALLDRLSHEYHPETPTESFLVEEAARAQWRLNRVYIIEREVLSGDPNTDSPLAEISRAFTRDCTGPQLLLKLNRYEQSARRAWFKALEKILDLRALKEASRRQQQVAEEREACRQAREAEAAVAGFIAAPVPVPSRAIPAKNHNFKTKPMPAHLERELAAHRRRDPFFDPIADRSQMSKELRKHYDSMAA